MMGNKVKIQVFETRFKLKESEGIVTKIMVKYGMPKLYQIQTELGTYYRRENELKFI